MFERKILQRIYGSTKDKRDWRIRYNHKLYRRYKEPDKTPVEHIQRMYKERIPKRIMKGQPEGRRQVGKPRARWVDGVNERDTGSSKLENTIERQK